MHRRSRFVLSKLSLEEHYHIYSSFNDLEVAVVPCESGCSCLFLHEKKIEAVAPGVFSDRTRLNWLKFYGNALGCVPGVPDTVQIIDPSSNSRDCLG